jgi:hypothetical protein
VLPVRHRYLGFWILEQESREEKRLNADRTGVTHQAGRSYKSSDNELEEIGPLGHVGPMGMEGRVLGMLLFWAQFRNNTYYFSSIFIIVLIHM